MDYLKAQLERLQQQISGLNASQKMLTATLVAIMLLGKGASAVHRPVIRSRTGEKPGIEVHATRPVARTIQAVPTRQ